MQIDVLPAGGVAAKLREIEWNAQEIRFAIARRFVLPHLLKGHKPRLVVDNSSPERDSEER